MQIKSGGVAKTTTVANLGNCLVRNGKKVLLIDFDPQADLTSSLGFKNADGMEHTIKTLMEKIITKQPIDKKEAIITNEEKIDLVPSNIELEALEASMINFENRENILRNYISKVKDDYDYILIDCRPSLGLLTINALASADSVIIPIQPQYLALKGMTQLVQAVDKVRVNINPKLKIEGILLTLADMNTNLAKTCEETVRRNYGGRIKVFKTVIPRGVKAAESTIDGKSIYAYDKKSKPAIAYEEFAKEVLKDSNRERFRTSECR